jgi:hypothetical protein
MKGSEKFFAGGMETARVPTAVDEAEMARRTETQETAMRYLKKTGNDDWVVVASLGLDQEEVDGTRRCDRCGDCIVSVKARTRYCSKACSASAAGERRHKRSTAT